MTTSIFLSLSFTHTHTHTYLYTNTHILIHEHTHTKSTEIFVYPTPLNYPPQICKNVKGKCEAHRANLWSKQNLIFIISQTLTITNNHDDKYHYLQLIKIACGILYYFILSSRDVSKYDIYWSFGKKLNPENFETQT